MAASSSDEARGLSHAARFKLLRELGSKDGGVWAALELLPTGRTKLVVAERVSRIGNYAEADIADWTRDARRFATLEHANVARVRDVVTRGEDVLVISDFIDGVRWSELVNSQQPPSLEIVLRVLTDVLSGLSAIHNLRDEKRQPLGLVHGGLTPEFIIVGLDGVARVVGAHRIRGTGADPGAAAGSYLAPEVLLADDAADPRADIYSVGVMLWEALSGRPLFANAVASAIVTQVLSGKVPRATIPSEAQWAAPIGDVVARALKGEVAKRLGSAAAFAAELRRIAGPRLAPTVRVAAFVRAKYGDPIGERRAALEADESLLELHDEVSGVEARSERASIEVEVEIDDRASTLPPPVALAPLLPQPAPPRLPPPRMPPTTIRGVNPPPSVPAPALAPAPLEMTQFEVPPSFSLPPIAPAKRPAATESTSTPATQPTLGARRKRVAGVLVLGAALAGAAGMARSLTSTPKHAPVQTIPAIASPPPITWNPPAPSVSAAEESVNPTSTSPLDDGSVASPAVSYEGAAANKNAPAPPPVVRSVPKRKYDPQGI